MELEKEEYGIEKEGLVQERWVCPAGLGTSLLKDWQMLVWVSRAGRSYGGIPEVRRQLLGRLALL